MTFSSRSLLTLIVALAIVVRLVFSLGLSRGVLGESPELQSTDRYHLIAANLIEGNGYRFQAGEPPTVERPPAYPIFLATIFALTGVSYISVQIAQALLSSLTCVLLFLFGRWILSSELGVVAALLYALYPNAIEYSALLYSENLYIPAFVGFAYLLCRASYEGSLRRGLTVGAVWGIGLLTRGTLLLLPLFLPFFFALSPTHRAAIRWRRWVVPAMAVGLAVLAPWMWRNYSLTRHVVPVSSVAWAAFYQGIQISKQATTWKDLAQVDIDAARRIDRAAYSQLPAGVAPSPADSVRRDMIAREMTLQEWRGNPAGTIGRAITGLGLAWFFTFGVKMRILSLAVHLPLLLLFVLGAVQMRRSEPSAFVRAWPALGLIMFVNLFHAVAYAHIRYMAPALALSFVYSSFSLANLYQRIRSWRQV